MWKDGKRQHRSPQTLDGTRFSLKALGKLPSRSRKCPLVILRSGDLVRHGGKRGEKKERKQERNVFRLIFVPHDGKLGRAEGRVQMCHLDSLRVCLPAKEY